MRGVYERERGSGIWWIRWTDAAGKLHREKAGTKKNAIRLVELRRTEVLQNKKLPIRMREKVSFKSLCEDALTYSKTFNTPKVTEDLELRFRRLEKDWGDRNVLDIKRHEILTWLEEESLANDWKPATRNRYQAAFSLAFRVGVENARIETNPAAGIRRKKENNGRTRFLLKDEETKLRSVIARRFPEYFPQLDISLHTGMRSAEQFSLRWDQIDFETRVISLYETKNGSVRHIPMNDVVYGALQELRSRTDTDWVFPSARGGHLDSARGWFPSAVAEAGLEDYTWHCNRHTFASRLIMAGVDLRTVGEILGHKSLDMTLRYSHVDSSHKTKAVNRLVEAPELTPAENGDNLVPASEPNSLETQRRGGRARLNAPDSKLLPKAVKPRIKPKTE